MTEKIDKLPAITNLSKKEKKILKDNLVKFHVISNVLDCLAINKFLYGQESVCYKDVDDWLNKKSTASYDWNVPIARIELWLHEMMWLNLISFDEQTQKMSFTENGLNAYKKQQFHLAYASMLQAKSSSNLAKTSLWIAVSTLVVTALGIIVTIILK
jgi:hypothetical protein